MADACECGDEVLYYVYKHIVMLPFKRGVTSRLLTRQLPGSFAGLKRPGRDVDHSPPSNTTLRMGCSLPLLPLISLFTLCLLLGQ